MFDISGKVALVTGGASGIGLHIVKELLRNGLRACTIADVNESFGKEAIETINEEFGLNKAVFIQTDVTIETQFKAAFEITVEKFQNIDILVNNAGILNDAIWERQIAINVQGMVYGVLLGLENYLQKYRTGSEGVIINSASLVAIDGFKSLPVYTATKCAVLGLSKTFGAKQHYERTQVKVLTICPGITDTPLVSPALVSRKTLGVGYRELLVDDAKDLSVQLPESVAKAVAYIIKNGESGSAWMAEGDEPPYELDFPTRHQLKKEPTKYV